MTRFVAVSLITILLSATLGAPLAAEAPKNAPAAGNHVSVLPEYRIGPEDTIQITVWKNDAMSRTVPVRPDGKISLPLVNDIQAAGLTPMELREVLVNRIKEFIPSPEVSVIVVEPKSFKVSIIGEVPRPGRYELRSRTTVLDVLAMAGGITQFAARSRIFVIRRNGTANTRIPFNYNRATASESEQDNFYVQNDDIIVVP